MVSASQNLRLIPGRGLQISPWKNGAGNTREILIYPEHSALTDFDWRLSIATVEQEGEFSVFPDIDRHIMLLDGECMVLHGETQEQVLLPYQAYAFRGEQAIRASLPQGSTTDVNLMLRRGRAQGELQAWTAPHSGLLEAGHTLLHSYAGTHEVILGHSTHHLEQGDTLWLQQAQAHQHILRVQPYSAQNCLIYAHIQTLI